LSFRLALRDAQVVAAVRGEDVGDLFDLAVEAGRIAVHLYDQRGLCRDGQPDLDIRLDHAHHFLIHHLQRGGHQPRRNDCGHGRARRLVGTERDHHRLDRRRVADQPDRRFGDERQRPFAADDQPVRSSSRIVERLPAGAKNAAIGQHRLDAGDIVGGDAVLETVGSASVFTQVAADQRGASAGRVGRVVKA
jgi:hypothetical protein